MPVRKELYKSLDLVLLMVMMMVIIIIAIMMETTYNITCAIKLDV